jgi:DNA-binding NarL/FixJ family response regulator
MLNQFIRYFHHGVKSIPDLLQAYQIKFKLQPNNGSFSLNEYNKDLSLIRNAIMQELTIPDKKDKPINPLTEQQIKIMHWLHLGKTIQDIAIIMNIAEVTVNKHIANIKTRLGCYTQFQLGEIYSHIKEK